MTPITTPRPPLYPLLFRPKFVEKIWGGRKIETVLGKPLPAGKQVGESWELYDFPPGATEKSADWVSVPVANGPLAGRTLHQLVTDYGADLLGSVKPAAAGQFPILIKYLDAREDLSVQVHPDPAYAAAHPDAHLKSEAWYVLEHDPDARILKGLAAHTTRDKFEAAIADGTVESHIDAVKVKPGDCHYLPSGTVHALGAGILVAEVQMPSDTTFRVFDFNRVDATTGQPRQLHVEQAMACIDFENRDSAPEPATGRLVDCEHFKLDEVRLAAGGERPVSSGAPIVWMVLEGRAEVRVDRQPAVTVGRGDTVLLPARLDHPVVRAAADCVWLEVTFPTGA